MPKWWEDPRAIDEWYRRNRTTVVVPVESESEPEELPPEVLDGVNPDDVSNGWPSWGDNGGEA